MMGGLEVARFLSSLADEGQVSPSTQSQAFSALLFPYRDFLGQPLEESPAVLAKAEMKRLPAQLDGVGPTAVTLTDAHRQ